MDGGSIAVIKLIKEYDSDIDISVVIVTNKCSNLNALKLAEVFELGKKYNLYSVLIRNGKITAKFGDFDKD